MKMKALAVAVAALACGTQAFAAEIYNDANGTSMAIGGHVSVGVGEYDSSGDVKVHQVSPRLNVGGKKDIGNGVTVDAKGEWALNYLNGGESSFSTRLGYIGATHEQFGRVVVGTQWSPYYDVGGVADMPIAFANDFLYSNHNELGSGRAERMVSYRKAFQFGDGFAFNLGLGWQGDNGAYDQRGQIALSTEFFGVGLGYVYSGGDVHFGSPTGTQDASSHVFSAKYGSYGSGIYAAAVFGLNEYFYDGYSDTIQLEGLFAYALNDWTFSLNYESVEDDDANDTLYSEMAAQAEYAVTSSFYTFAGYQLDLEDDDDLWIFGARYYF